MGDMQGENVHAAVTDTSNASITASDGRNTVTVMAEATSAGPVTVTVEVSQDGTNWFERTGVFSSDVSASAAEAENLATGAKHVRASGDANVARIEVAAKGL